MLASIICEETLNTLLPEGEVKQASLYLTSQEGGCICQEQFQASATYKNNSYSFLGVCYYGKVCQQPTEQIHSSRDGHCWIKEIHTTFREHDMLKMEPVCKACDNRHRLNPKMQTREKEPSSLNTLVKLKTLMAKVVTAHRGDQDQKRMRLAQDEQAENMGKWPAFQWRVTGWWAASVQVKCRERPGNSSTQPGWKQTDTDKAYTEAGGRQVLTRASNSTPPSPLNGSLLSPQPASGND